MLGIKILKETFEKTLSLAHRRDLARKSGNENYCSYEQVCEFFKLNRSTFRHEAHFPNTHRCREDKAIGRLNLKFSEWEPHKIGQPIRNEKLRLQMIGSYNCVVKGDWLCPLRGKNTGVWGCLRGFILRKHLIQGIFEYGILSMP